MGVVNRYPVAANEDSFWPAEFKNDTFITWAHQAVLRIVNLSPGSSSENRVRQVLVADGMPCPTWISALLFMMEQVRSGRRSAKNGGASCVTP